MIRIQNLVVSFSTNKVLNNLSIDFQHNQVHGIIGLNGAGKTTFFNALSRSLKIDSGHINIDDRPISGKDVAYLETINFFYSRITGNEYLKIFKQTNLNFDLHTLQTIFKLPLNDLIETYSTGMKKKLALLGILKQHKLIYLFDEPFNGLDLEANKFLEIIITTLKKKEKTIFVSSHIIDPLLMVCDVIHFLENGQFTKTFNKADFHKIEDELFKKLKIDAATIISKSI